MNRFVFALSAYCFFTTLFSAEENFLLIHGATGETVAEMGPCIDERFSPCSTFKIPLSLMGYDAHVLQDKQHPTWYFQEGYDDFLPTWKGFQTPLSWMQRSCVWYSKVLALELGLEKMHSYLASWEYGNQDLSGGLPKPGPENPAWIRSSLAISPREQVIFLQGLVQEKLLASPYAFLMTKAILFKEELAQGWRLFGKTGWSGSDDIDVQFSWFVGWIEKESKFFPFAYLIREKEIDLNLRIPRVKELLDQAGVLAP